MLNWSGLYEFKIFTSRIGYIVIFFFNFVGDIIKSKYESICF